MKIDRKIHFDYVYECEQRLERELLDNFKDYIRHLSPPNDEHTEYIIVLECDTPEEGVTEILAIFRKYPSVGKPLIQWESRRR